MARARHWSRTCRHCGLDRAHGVHTLNWPAGTHESHKSAGAHQFERRASPAERAEARFQKYLAAVRAALGLR